jgi:DNA-binding NarL/FixJ family response regulator
MTLNMRILIADDHELVRRGLRSLLASRTGWNVCGEAKDGLEAVEKAKQLHPDVVLLDITMPELNGLDAARIIRKDDPNMEIVILSQHDPREMTAPALQAGAREYISKSDVASGLLVALEAIERDLKSRESRQSGSV